MSKTIAGTVTSAFTLTAAYDPLVILATGKISTTGTAAIYGDASQAWFITNAGVIQNAGQFGIELQSGSTIANNGFITDDSSVGEAVRINGGAGLVTNSAFISGDFDGVVLTAGGTVNNTSGEITGTTNDGVYISGGAATVTNAGHITGGTYAVQFHGSFTDRLIIDAGAVFTGKIAGGSGSNTLELAAGTAGTIGTLTGLGSNYTGFGTVTVDGGASWKLDSTSTVAYGVALTDAGTLANAGLINAIVTVASGGTFSNTGFVDNHTIAYGVSLLGSGVVNNGLGGATGANITGYQDGILANGGAATISNAGSIYGRYKYGVALSEGGSVGNTGAIRSFGDGVAISGGAGTVTNSGSISAGINGVQMFGGGVVTNTGAIETFTNIGVYIGGGSATVTNAGQIVTTKGSYAVQFAGSFADRVIIDPGALFTGVVQGGSGSNTLELAADSHGATGHLTAFAGEFQNFGTIAVDGGANWQMDGSDTIASGILLTDAGTLNSTGVIDTTVTVAAAGYFSNTGTVNAGTGQVGVTLLAGGTVINTAAHPLIEAARYGIRAQAAAATVVNNATILGTSSLNGGGIGLYAGGNITNNGTITGNGANGVYIGGGAATLTNAGTITGVTDSVKFAGSYTDRVIDRAGAVFHGTVQGGSGSNTLELQAGTKSGTGTLSGFGTSFTKFGTVTVDQKAVWQFDATDTIGSAVLLTDNGTLGSAALIDATVTLSNFASLSNTGTITTSTTGVYGGNATLTNSGTIEGGLLSRDVAVQLAAGSRIVNSGDIGLGIGSNYGIVLNGGGTITNASTPGAMIYGKVIGVLGLAGGQLTLTNGGQIVSQEYGVMLAGGGLITNTGTIDAFSPGADVAILSSSQAATVVNSGTILGYIYGIDMLGGGSVSNTGSIGGANAGVYISGQAGTVTNGGTISGTDAVQFEGTFADRVIMKPGAVFNGLVHGGTGTNTLELAAGSAGAVGTLASFASFAGFGTLTVDSGAAWKIAAGNTIAFSVSVYDNGTLTNAGEIDTGVTVGAGASLVNSGSILSGDTGVYLLSGGALTNTGLIEYGCSVENGTGTVTNSGTIDAIFTSVAMFGGGTLANTGQITAFHEDSRTVCVDIQGGAGMVTNSSGFIRGYFDGVALQGGGSVLNEALIFANFNDGVYIGGGAGTVTNAGTIDGGVQGYAVQFGGSFADRVIFDAGAIFNGKVQGGSGSNTLELAAGSPDVTGTLGSFSTGFMNVGTIAIDAGASWVFAATNTIGSGVTLTDAGKLSNAGLIDTAVTLSAALSLGNTGTINGGSTQQGVVMLAGGTLVNSGLIEGSNGVSIAGSAALVTNSANIDGATYGVAMSKGGTLHNTGTIASTSHGEAVLIAGGKGLVTNTGSLGGIFDGVVLTGGGTVQNSGTISGGGNFGVYIGGGAATLTNSGTISGSADAVAFNGSFADRVIFDAGAVFQGAVHGGSGSNTLELAAGSAGGVGTLSSFASAFTGFGAISIDSGAKWAIASTSTILSTGASTQVYFTDAGTLTNAGVIDTTVHITANRSLANSGTITTNLGTGVVLQDGGTLTNTGNIKANGANTLGVHALGAATTITNSGHIAGTLDGVELQLGGTVTNQGSIAGGSRTGIYISGGAATVTNAGTISGGTYAVQFAGSFTDRLILDAGAALKGKAKGGSGTNTLELAAGKAGVIGTLSSFATSFAGFGAIAIDAGANWKNAAGSTIGSAVSITDAGTLSNAGVIDTGITTTASTSINNSGTIDGANYGIFIQAGGTLTNTGLIEGNAAGILAPNAETITNSGTISGAGYGIELAHGGTITNTGRILATASGTTGHGIFVTGGAGKITNAGVISSSTLGLMLANGGLITNTGSIGGSSTGVVISGAAGTITNAGTISGGTDAVQFNGSFADRVILEAGAAFQGKVQGGSGSNTLALAGGSGGVLSNFASIFAGFGAIAVDSGATWTVASTSTILPTGASTQVYFTDAGSLTNAGVIDTTLRVTANRSLANNGTIATGLGTGVVLLDGGFIANGGTITATGLGQVGIHAIGAATSINNGGTIAGTLDGVELQQGGTVTNTGVIAGTSHAGLYIGGGAGTVTAGNFGTISGGTYAVQFSGDFADRLILDPGTVLQGKVEGGSGTNTLELAAGVPTAGGTLANFASEFKNFGQIAVDSSANWSLSGTIASAVDVAGNVSSTSGTLAFLGTVTDSGTIDAAGGLISFQTSVGGTGTLQIGATGTLSLALGAGAGQAVDFSARTGLLDLADPLAFTGTISGFSASDRIDLLSTPESSYSYVNNILTVKNGTNTVASLHFTGNSNSFSLTSDTHGGTFIVFT